MTYAYRRAVWLAVGGALCAAGCGPDIDCTSHFDACGGDIVGSYHDKSGKPHGFLRTHHGGGSQ